jgi:hypothetical protein
MSSERFSRAFQRAQDNFSTDIRIRYFNQFGDDTYDDSFSLVQSGTDLWCSGITQDLNKTEGSIDSNLLEQGKIITNDTKIFINGSINLTGSEKQVKVQIGSPTGEQYSIIPLGGLAGEVNGVNIFKQIYVRRLTNGSLINEYIGSP